MQFLIIKTIQVTILWLVMLLQINTTDAATPEKQKKPTAQKPNWSLEFKFGRFEPDIEDWKTFYGNDYTHQFAGAFAYKIKDQIEIGMQGGWIRDKGKGYLPINNTTGGKVKYQLFPLDIFILFRGVYTPQQWIVPYMGGGWSRTYYKANIQNQSSIDGAENGTHYRVGIQFLLNKFYKKGTRNLKSSFGIINTNFFIEVQELKTEVDALNLNLGGKNTMIGILLEY